MFVRHALLRIVANTTILMKINPSFNRGI